MIWLSFNYWIFRLLMSNMTSFVLKFGGDSRSSIQVHGRLDHWSIWIGASDQFRERRDRCIFRSKAIQDSSFNFWPFPQKLRWLVFYNLLIQSVCHFCEILSFTFLSHRRFFGLQGPHSLHRMSQILDSQLSSPSNQSLAPLILLWRLLNRWNFAHFGLIFQLICFLIEEFTSHHIFASAFSVKIIYAIFKMLILVFIFI